MSKSDDLELRKKFARFKAIQEASEEEPSEKVPKVVEEEDCEPFTY